MTEGWKFAGAKFDDTLNNIGLALLIAGITQYYTDFRVRSRFYKDVSDNVIANETLRESGILKFFRDSKTCIPAKVLDSAKTLDVGVTYSDRFLKDNIGILVSRAGSIRVRVYCVDADDADVRRLVALNTGFSDDDVRAEYRKLTRIVDDLVSKGVNIELFKQKTLPHYSFYIIDDYYFLTMSTFASRRATVPLFQMDQSSPLALLIREDRDHVMALNSTNEKQATPQ
ncbi:hypothetical protein [Sphingomonas faeni]|nr:hypothetical protein [Sphingomonas faeni]